MPKLWEVIHELKNGRAVKTGCITYFLKSDQVFFITQNYPESQLVSTQLVMHADAEVIDMPDALIPKVDFFAAMEALKAGKRAYCLDGGRYVMKNKKICYDHSGEDVADFTSEELTGDWVIL